MKKYIAIILGVAFLMVVGVFVASILQKKDLKDAIAAAVNADPNALILNLPPMPARFPGTILAPREKFFMIYAAGDQSNDELIEGDDFTIDATIQNLSQAGSFTGSNIFTTTLNNSDHLEVNLKISNAKVIELLIPTLKQIAKKHSSVQSALKRGLNPLIVRRSYFGNVEYILKAKNQVGMDALIDMADMGYKIAEKRSGKFKFTDRLESDKEVSFSISKPIVFAFELMGIGSLTTELSNDYSEISLTPVSSRRVSNIDTPITNYKPNYNQKKPKWGLITISSAHYTNDAQLNTPQAAEGANLVEEFFRQYNPTFVKRIWSTKDNPITDEKLLDWSINLTMDLLNEPVDHLLIYYAGHGLSLPNGELLLLQGNVNKDFAERALDASNPQTASNGDGLMLAETLYSAFGAAGVPFTLLIDACYPNDEMQESLTRVSMTLGSRDGSNLYYFGDQALITDEMSQVGNTISEIGQRFPYRREDNAVIFSTKPGARAVYQENSINPYGFDLPPLASRIIRYSQYAPVVQGDQSIADVIRVNIDLINGIGGIGLDGTITWSNIEPMLSTFKHVYRD